MKTFSSRAGIEIKLNKCSVGNVFSRAAPTHEPNSRAASNGEPPQFFLTAATTDARLLRLRRHPQLSPALFLPPPFVSSTNRHKTCNYLVKLAASNRRSPTNPFVMQCNFPFCAVDKWCFRVLQWCVSACTARSDRPASITDYCVAAGPRYVFRCTKPPVIFLQTAAVEFHHFK